MSADKNIPWYVIRTNTNARVEFEVRHALNQQEYQAMVPFEEKWITKSNGKPKSRKFPFFPGYVFVGLPDKYEFPSIRDRINQVAEDMGKLAPIVGLIGSGHGDPARLTEAQVWKYKLASVEEPAEVDLVVGTEIEVFRGTGIGQQSRVRSFTKDGVRAEIRIFNSYRVVEIPRRDVRPVNPRRQIVSSGAM